MENEEAGQKDQKKHKSKRPIGKIALLVLLLVMVIFKEDLLLFNVGLFLLVAGWTLFGMANPRLALPWLPPEKRTRPRLLFRGLISSVLIVCIIVWSLAGPVNMDTDSGNLDNGSVELISQDDIILWKTLQIFHLGSHQRKWLLMMVLWWCFRAWEVKMQRV